jgi:primosomal protein N' (replication factor Y)
MIAKVLVDVKAKQVNKMYDYKIPNQFLDILSIGARVIVPFGPRKVMGYCLDIKEKSDFDLKEIIQVIDVESYLTEELIEIAKSLSEETGYLLISVLETILPSALKVMYKPRIEVLNYDELDQSLKPVFAGYQYKYLSDIDPQFYPIIKKEMQKKHLKQNYEIKKKNKSLNKRFVKLNIEDSQGLTDKQQLVFDYLKERKDLSDLQKIICNKLKITSSVIKTMEKHGYVVVYDDEVLRQVNPLFKIEDKDVELNQEQREVFEQIKAKMNQEHTILLHGVTGSGKTEIYFKAIESVIKKDKQVILLVPEISLTPMMIQRFKSRFNERVASIHSGLSSMEKYDEWRKIIRGDASIIIGARSACFAPVKDLGLMIVDECHESTYKQTEQLPYYAIDILKRRSNYHDALLLLGSATPNIESYARAQRGYYQLLTLKKRALNSQMPTINIVNMLEEFKAGNKEELSNKLLQAIEQRINNNQQVMLLMNRRGFSNFVICRACGHVVKCKNCDISLTHHKHSNVLKCHYCAYEESVPHTCENCGSKDLEFMGSGTQKIEDILKNHFPNANIYRMDRDTTTKKNAHEYLLHRFQENGDILIGTQMIAKGLDFPRVTLVGILQADGNLFVPDFRAPEKTFQLIMQVSGRSGRRDTLGEVIIQAYNPDHYAIKYAYKNDYIGFYEHEMRLRRIARYEPFYYLIQLDTTGKSIKHLMVFAMNVVRDIKRQLSRETICLGPSSDIIKIKNKYTTSIMIKYKDEPNIQEVIKQAMEKYAEKDILIKIDHFPGVG